MSKAKTPEPKKDEAKSSQNVLDELLNEKDNKSLHFNHIVTKPVKIPSGSLLLDSYVSIRSGTVLRMGGPAETGKTSQSFLFADNYMKEMPKSKTLYVNAESKFSQELQDRTGMKFTTDPQKWDYGTVFVLKSNVFDIICDTIYSMYKKMFESGEHLCVIIDSVDMLTLKSNFEKGMTEGRKPAGVNYLTKELFRRVCPFVENYNGLLIMITQYSATFQLDPYSKAPPQMMEGNQTNALNHQASYGFYYRPRFNGDFILNKEKERPDPVTNPILGVVAKVEIKKSASDQSGITLEIPIKRGKVGNCVWTEKELSDLLFIWDLAEKRGSWIELRDTLKKMAEEDKVELKLKHQGMNQLFDYFEENPYITKWLTKKFALMNG